MAQMTPREILERSLNIAADTGIYTGLRLTIDESPRPLCRR
jgi:ATP-dependent protease HslVU (ClpYQ) peptidase subunit